MAQLIRRSQFITTYGPGAILEGHDGPRIIPTLDRSTLFDGGARPGQFEITDLRLSQALLANARIMRLPSNAELLVPESQAVYRTERFPKWSLCVRHLQLYRKSTNDVTACPGCPPSRNTYDAWRQSGREAIRFVVACKNGHLDDVNWHLLLRHTCRPAYLIWDGAGGALRNVTIRCPNCNATENFGIAYARDWPCTGKLPERGVQEPCGLMAKIIQRGAANLRMPALVSALTIPPRSTNLHRIFEIEAVLSFILTGQPDSKAKVITALQNLATAGRLSNAIPPEVATYNEDAILGAIRDTLAMVGPGTLGTMLQQEFDALRDSALRGAPPVPSPTPGSPDQFEVCLGDVRHIPLRSGRLLRITPVSRLRVVLVQQGYARMEDDGRVVDIAFPDNQITWYPGVELFGEGIFIDFVPTLGGTDHHFNLTGQGAFSWQSAWQLADPTEPENRRRLHPVFTWWHTLSHRLITALSIDSGYSSASVRERVYASIDDTTGAAVGGVLLYTTQPGGDGTLGGLIGLVPAFERVVASAFRNLDSCSNDPLCGEEKFEPGKVNGAACYACALVSETSCEFRNMGLDRNLLLDNLP